MNLLNSDTCKHGGGSVMACGSFVASGSGWLAVTDGTMNFALYQKIIKETVWASVYALKLKQTQVIQQDNSLKHSNKSTSEWLKKDKNKIKILE